MKSLLNPYLNPTKIPFKITLQSQSPRLSSSSLRTKCSLGLGPGASGSVPWWLPVAPESVAMTFFCMGELRKNLTVTSVKMLMILSENVDDQL